MLDCTLAILGRGWRVLATGFCFALFGLCALSLGLLVCPLLHLLVRPRARRVDAVRTAIRLTLRAFVALMRLLGVLRYEILGQDKLARGGLLILANHPTLIDTVFLMAFVKRADCIVKSALWRNPFTKAAVRAAGYVSNEEGAQLVKACLASLDAGNNLIVFPEGTRTGADGVIKLKRGGANIAVRGVRAVTPVLISCQPLTLGKGEPWWRVPVCRAHFRIEVKDDIAVLPFTQAAGSHAIAARHLNQYLQQYFTEGMLCLNKK
jgi:1-acyl-sn-glycerol-3-phosphate acyltransferase